MTPTTMTLEQLDAAMEDCVRQQQQVQQQREALKAIALAAQQTYDALAAEKTARLQLARLSDVEKAALLQQLTGAGGMASGAQVGTPGR